MRRLAITLVAATLAALPAVAQQPAPAERGNPAAVAAFRDAVKADKRAVVAKNMELTEAEAKKFWPLYEAYQVELDKATQRQNRAVIEYVNQASSMTDANAKRIARELLDADAQESRLRETQLKKLYTILPARKAVRYMQIENKVRLLNKYDLGAQIPLVQ
jgi:Spy/CpxP family protein refolding chaperone